MLTIDRTTGSSYIEKLSEVSLSLDADTGLGAFATTGMGDTTARWGQVLAAVLPETVDRFVSRLRLVQDRGLWTDTTTLFDVAEIRLGSPFRPWCYIHWALKLPESEFFLLSAIGCCSTLDDQDYLTAELDVNLDLIESPSQVVDMIRAIRRPVDSQGNPPLHHYAADVVARLGLRRALAY